MAYMMNPKWRSLLSNSVWSQLVKPLSPFHLNQRQSAGSWRNASPGAFNQEETRVQKLLQHLWWSPSFRCRMWKPSEPSFQNYPGELLTPQSMPSLSFLSILKEAIDGNCLAWVPWKNRTSESDEQAFLEHRRPRNERQLLRSLLAEGESALHDQPDFFPSNAFMAFARSLHTFNCSKKMNCKLSCKAVYTSIALVMDLYTVQWAVPSKTNHKKKNKQDTRNHNKTKTKKHREVGSLAALRNKMHDDIVCVIMSMATENEAKQRQHGTTQRGHARGW